MKKLCRCALKYEKNNNINTCFEILHECKEIAQESFIFSLIKVNLFFLEENYIFSDIRVIVLNNLGCAYRKTRKLKKSLI